MPRPFIDVKFEPGARQLASRISSLPKQYQEEVLDEVAGYGLEVLRQYPPQKRVTRRQAYPNAPVNYGWFSKKQRAWFFAVGIHRTPHRRTGGLAKAWRAIRQGMSVRYTNSMPGAEFVMGSKQSAHERLVGWKTAAAILSGALTFRSSKFRRAVEVAYQRAIRKLKLG